MEYSSYTGNKTRVAPFVATSTILLAFAILEPFFALPANASAITESQASELGPGGYLWDPSAAPSGVMTTVVKLDSQRAFVWRNGKLIGISVIASGKPGYETPDGTFTVLEKQVFHRSNKYDDAPMPYMQRLTWSGLALHGGHPRGHPASHGCIRLPMGFAAALYKEDTKGMKVVITGQPPARAQTEVANRQKSSPARTGDLQDTEFSNGQVGSNPVAPGVSERAGSGEVNDDAGYSAADGDATNSYPDQSEDNQRYYGSDRRSLDRDVPPGVPPEDLPPPPN